VTTPPITALRQWLRRSPFDAGFLIGGLFSLALYAFVAEGGFPLASRIGHREHYYTVAALGLLHGRLWVPRSALTFECFIVRGHCYGYFGIAPTLFRLPLAALFGPGIKDNRTELAFFLLGFFVLAGGTWWIARQLVALWAPAAGSGPLTWMGLLTGLAGLGATPLIFLVSRPLVYEEAILWGVAFGTVALGAAISLWRRPRASIVAVLLAADVLGMLSRPTSGASGLPATLLLGAWLLLEARRRRRGRGSGLTARRPLALGLCLIAGTGLAAVSASGVNYAKFHAFSPPYPDQLLLEGKASHIAPFSHFAGLNLAVLPTRIVAELRPDAIRLPSHRPFVAFGEFRPLIVWPAKPIDIVWEPMSSVTDTLPFDLLAALIGAGVVVGAGWRRWRSQRPDPALAITAIVAASALAALVVDMAFPGQTFRYLVDWLPALVIGLTIGLARVIGRPSVPRRRAAAVAVVTALLLGAQLFVQLSFAVQSGLTSDRAFRPHCSGSLNPYGPVGTLFCPVHLKGNI
jgi:hypothetical protein